MLPRRLVGRTVGRANDTARETLGDKRQPLM